MARLLVCPSTSVWPSGADLATLSTPRLPPAPGRVSTSTLPWFCSALFFAPVRAVMSEPLPRGNGATRGGGERGRRGEGAGRDSRAAPGGCGRAGPPAPAPARRRRTGAGGAGEAGGVQAGEAKEAAWSLVSVANITRCALVSRHRSSVGLRWPSKRIAALHRLPIRSVWAARCTLRCAPMAARSLRHLIGD